MELKIIGTGSKGNSYLFRSSTGETLMVECGVNFKEVKKAMNFDCEKIVGCILTHCHGDHSKAIHDVLAHGIKVYSALETLVKLEANRNYYARALDVLEYEPIGSFLVLSFDVKHDAVAPLGFIIYHEEMGRTLFLTDTYYVEYKFEDLNNILIEANYDIDLVGEGFLKDRIIQSHMSIEQCINTLKDNDLSNVNHIVLLHLSDRNSNAKDFKKRVEQSTGKNVIIADKGVTITDFNISF